MVTPTRRTRSGRRYSKPVNSPSSFARRLVSKAGEYAVGKATNAAINYGLNFINRKRKAWSQPGPQFKKSKVLRTTAADHNDMTKHVVKSWLKPGKYKKQIGTFEFNITREKVLEQNIKGAQLHDLGYSIARRDHYTGTVIATAPNDFLPIDPFQLNPYSQNNTNDMFPATRKVANTGKLGLMKVKQQILLVNLTSAPVDVVVHWVLCKKDDSRNPIEKWQDLLQETNQNAGMKAATFYGPLGVETYTGGHIGTATYGASPWQVRSFKKFWKMVGKDKFVLQGGDQKKISIEFDYNRYLSRDIFVKSLGDFMAGYTIFPLILARGAGVGIGVDEVTAMTFASIKLGLIQTDRYIYGAVPAAQGVNTIAGAIGIGFGVGTGVAEQIIDDNDQDTVVKEV